MSDPKKPTDPELIRELMLLKQQDPDKFMELVYNSIMSFPDEAINDGEDPKKKADALKKMIDHFIETEQYEKCAFLQKISEKVNGKKGSVPDNEQ